MRLPLLLALCVLALTLLEFRVVELVHGRNLAAQAAVAEGILAGRPYWKAYQNRLLGPLAVEGAARLLGRPFVDVYRWAVFALLTIANATAFLLFGWRRGEPWTAWGYAAVGAGLFVAFQDPEWLYLWDLIDLTTGLLFAWMVVMGGGWPTGWLALLFLAELANRESAQFIALWLVLESILPEKRLEETQRRWLDVPRFALGVILGVVGTVWTHHVRTVLCQGEVGVIPRPEIHEFSDGQFFMGRVTLDLLREGFSVPLATLLVLGGSLGFLLWRTRRLLGSRAWRVAALLAAMVVANGLLAFVYELRVWFALLPFVLCLAYRWHVDAARAAVYGARP